MPDSKLFLGHLFLMALVLMALVGGFVSPAPHQPADRLNQFGGIVADSIFEYDLHILNSVDLLRRITLDHHQVCLLAGRNCSDAIDTELRWLWRCGLPRAA